MGLLAGHHRKAGQKQSAALHQTGRKTPLPGGLGIQLRYEAARGSLLTGMLLSQDSRSSISGVSLLDLNSKHVTKDSSYIEARRAPLRASSKIFDSYYPSRRKHRPHKPLVPRHLHRRRSPRRSNPFATHDFRVQPRRGEPAKMKPQACAKTIIQPDGNTILCFVCYFILDTAYRVAFN